jgi:hypothetical protein
MEINKMIPQNEMGVIVVFAEQAKEAGFEIVSIGAEFPDAIIKRGTITYRVEFEYKTSNFIQHCHDLRQCDLIICWIDDAPDYFLPILALSDPGWKLKDIVTPDIYKAEIAYWKERALKAERKTIKPTSKQPKPRRLSKQESFVKICELLANNPKASLREVSLHIGRPKSTTGNYVNQLMEAGEIEKNGHGWRVNE